MPLKIAYLVHDLTDPAVARRVKILTSGGASVKLAGFYRRSPETVIGGCEALPLSRTEDAKLLRRALAVVRTLTRSRPLRDWAKGQDVIIARNLETLLLAARIRRPGQALVYECLDIHRMMFRKDVAGRALRALERKLLGQCDLVITSSPAFRDAYFRSVQHYEGEVLLLENKPLALGAQTQRSVLPPSGPPWRIGWFGMLRCRKSLRLLEDIVVQANGRVDVLMAGMPARSELTDLDEVLKRCPGLRYVGPYDHAGLAELYGQVHFSWCIDFFEEGANSAWLLPNRLYESAGHGVVPIALESVQTGAWLRTHGIGVCFDDLEKRLPAFFGDLDKEDYARMRRAVEALPRELLIFGRRDCEALVQHLANLR